MNQEPTVLEQEACSFLSQEKFEEAFRLFRRAAELHKGQGNSRESALCFASAASCWSKKCGERSFYNAAASYEEAAKASAKSRDFQYASVLYKYAAINHERDGEFFRYSECLYSSKEAYRKFLTRCILSPHKIYYITEPEIPRGITGVVRRFFSWFVLTLSSLIWGHGERPSKSFATGVVVIFLSTFFYILGSLYKGGRIFEPNFFEAFYFSVVTFTTVGYGDIVPVGWSKLVAIIESFSGLFIMPLFIIALSRKYLRT